MAGKTKFFRAEAVPFWALVTFLFLTFWTGGASRADVQSLVILRPAAILFCGIGLWSLKAEHVRQYRFVFGMAGAIFALLLLHLVPLPPMLWGALPGRQLLVEVDKAAGIVGLWRPLSLIPTTTWNAFFSLFVPLAILLLGTQLSREECYKLLPWMLGFALFSGFWSILQIVGPDDSPLYLYAVTGNGSANGLFANRNHQAVLLACLFPMLAAFVANEAHSDQQRAIRLWSGIGVGLVLIPLIIITGSRAGVLLGLVGLLLIPTFYRRRPQFASRKQAPRKFDLRYGIGAMAILGLGALSLLVSRGEALQRLFMSEQLDDDRFSIWGPIARMTWKYFPFGSGIGSFVETYQIDEPNELLSPEYYNHAHMDWLETCLTGGLPALLLLAFATFAFVRAAAQAFRAPLGDGRRVVFARVGAVLVTFFALESTVDYPLRVPSLSCLFVIAILWLANGENSPAKRASGV